MDEFDHEGTFSCFGASEGVRWPASDRMALNKGYRYLTGTVQGPPLPPSLDSLSSRATDSESQLIVQTSNIHAGHQVKESISFTIDTEGVIVPVWVDEDGARSDGEFFYKNGEGAFLGITR